MTGVALRALLALSLLATPSAAESGAAHAAIARIAAGAPRTRVLVLATPHLAGIDGFESKSLEPVLDQLESFRPTIICIEAIPPASLAAMEEAGGLQADVAAMFAAKPIEIGRALRTSLGLTRREAETRATAARAGGAALSPARRAEVAGWLVAAYDFGSAVLQWSLLSPAERAEAALPDDVKNYLDARLASSNEITTIAIALARRAGIQTLAAVDSHFDGAELLASGEDALAEVFQHPLGKASGKHPVYARSREVTAAGIAEKNFLPVYRFFNSDAYLIADAEAQWGWYWQSKLDSGLDRFRYGLWEARNIAIASNVAMQTASPRAERVLLLIGAAHKTFVEEHLRRMIHVKVVGFDELAREVEKAE